MERMERGGAAVGVVLALLLAGCTNAGAATPAAPTAAQAAPAATTPADVSGAEAVFTGRRVCTRSSTPPSPNPDPSAAVYYSCQQTATDSRLSGTVVMAARMKDPYLPYGIQVVENAGGSWSCQWAFSLFGPGDSEIAVSDSACVGQGGYAGLNAYVHLIADDPGGFEGALLGWIEKIP